MSKKPGSPQSRRWQDIRALAIDATFDADRRRVGERVAVVFRWLFLIVLGVLNNVNPNTDANEKVTIDFVLAGWGVMNVAVNVLIARGYQPGKQFSLSTMTLDGAPRPLPRAGTLHRGSEFDPAVVEALSRAVRDGGLELNVPDLALPATAAAPASATATA